jgi:hypothetical protein
MGSYTEERISTDTERTNICETQVYAADGSNHERTKKDRLERKQDRRTRIK